MKRGAPLQRRTPLRNTPKTHATHAQNLSAQRERPPTPPLDFSAAAAALAHQRTSAETPRAFGGPIADPVKADRPADDGAFSKQTRTLILMRDGYTCQRCGVAPGDAWPGINLQHRSARQMGGTSRLHLALPSNGIVLCGSGTTGCHGWVESHPELAEVHGLVVASWADPATVPVYTLEGWRLLDNAGTKRAAEYPPMGESHMVATRITPPEGPA